ncbi:MAG TPA: pentapeptide repeat-containing protein, partial [Pirellulales bacterium]
LIAADARRLQIGNNFRSSGGVPVGSDFSRTDLTISHFHRVDAAGARFTGATLSQALLAESVFPDVDFSHAALEGAVARDANFDGAVFAGANLRNFDAAGCSFQRADFRGARLEGANLSGADLTDARLEGVDLTNVNLGGARIDEAVAGAIGADQRVENVHRAGPLMPKLNEKLERQLDAAVMWRGSIGTRRYRAGIDFQKPSLAAFSIEVSAPPGDPNGELRTHPFRGTGGSLDELFTKIFAYLGPSATLDESSIECFFAEILKVARQALAEAFGLTPPSDDALAAERNQKRRDKSQLKQQLLADLRGGAEGVARWNARPATDFTQVGSLAGIDLSGATLDGLIVGRAGAANRIDLTDARFDGASLVNVNFANALLANVGFNKATLRNVTFSKLAYSVSFADAVLDDVNFHGVSLSLANFSGAKATNCRFTAANLQGADLSQGTFINCDWKGAYYNLDTRFPIGFTDVAKMRWVGPGLPPHELAAAREAVESSLVSATVAESPEQAAARRGERRQAFWEQVR